MSIPNKVPELNSLNGGLGGVSKTGAVPNSSDTVPMCLAGILLGAVVCMSKYDIEMMKQQIAYKMASAKAYAGVDETKVNGKEVWTALDEKKGIVERFINESVSSAKSAGDAIEDEAFGQFASAGVNLAGAAGTIGAGSFGGADDEVTPQLNNAKALQTKMESVDASAAPDLELGSGASQDSETLEEKQEQLEKLGLDRGNKIKTYLTESKKLKEEESSLKIEKFGREKVMEDVQKNPRTGLQGKEGDDSQVSFMKEKIKEADLRLEEIKKEQVGLDKEKSELEGRISVKKQEIADKRKFLEKSGIEAHIRSLNADEPDLSVFGKDSDLDDKALAHLKSVDPQKFEALQTKVNVRVEKLSVSDRETRLSKRSQRANLAGQLAGMGANAAQASGHVAQAKEQVESSKEKAYADTLMNLQQTWSGQLSDTQQRADSFLQDANAIVANLAAPMRG